jgi:hypothetical protein
MKKGEKIQEYCSDTKLEIFLAVKVYVIWIMMPCNDVTAYQRFRGPCRLHLQGEANVAGKGA